MNRHHMIAALGCGVAFAAILWRMTPPMGTPLDTAARVAGDTMGLAPVVPTLDASQVAGMSYGPGDGDPGPTWYTLAYPGSRPPMPPQASPVKPL